MKLETTRTITVSLPREEVFDTVCQLLPGCLTQIGVNTHVQEMAPDPSGYPHGYNVDTQGGRLRYIVGERRPPEYLAMDSLHLHHKTGMSFRCDEDRGNTTLTITVFFEGKGDNEAVEGSLRSLADALIQCMEAGLCPPPPPVHSLRPRRAKRMQK